MRALVLPSFGGPELFELRDVPVPALRPGHVLVRVAATSVNPIDIKMRIGQRAGATLPAILGCDVAGTVEAVGEGVASCAVGDRVFGFAGAMKVDGAMAEFMLADARLLARAPRNLPLREAAALPLVSITAWDAVSRCGVGPGDHVLVHAGAGGVGHIAVQLARARAARVAATVGSAWAAEAAHSIGADATIDRHAETVAAYVARLTGGRGFDVVFDTVGGANLAGSIEAAAPGGRVATAAARGTHDLTAAQIKGLSLHIVAVLVPIVHDMAPERHRSILGEVAMLAEAGRLRPLIDPTRFTLPEAAEAHRLLESGKARGKVVIDIAGSSC